MYADIIDADDVYQALAPLGLAVSPQEDLSEAVIRWADTASANDRAALKQLLEELLDRESLMLPPVFAQLSAAHRALESV
ncbi:MAG: hypothetical protein CMI02_04490 [Oceanospirillaceae bacterium]|nr:hypothetical protein [Oceanospirillaceae bacterium]